MRYHAFMRMDADSTVPQHQRPGIPDDRLLNATEVAGRLGVHHTTVRKMAQAGTLVCVRLSTRSVRFRPGDVEAFIASHVVTGR